VEAGLTDGWGFRFLADLTTEIGPRLAGTDAMTRAASWAETRLRAAGFANVHAEPFPMSQWVRGQETAQIVWPAPQNLAVTALGNSVATPANGIEAEIALFRGWQEFLAAPSGSLAGKIAVVTQRMARAADGGGYGALFQMRAEGPSEAAKRGAVAYLLRSLGTDSARRPHTGATDYADGVGKIPAAALSNPDADQLERLADRGTVKLRLVLTPKLSKDGQSANVVAEIPGTDHPDEIVLIGGHLDSWDLGTGAIDDGAGVAITAGAAHLIQSLPQRPKRTIRLVLFGAEERSFSGAAYTAAHAGEAASIVVAGEADFGARRAYSVQFPPGMEHGALVRSFADVAAPLGLFVEKRQLHDGGADIAGLKKLGVPVVSVNQDGVDYFDFHHTADDTLDKVDPRELAQATAAWAAWVWLAADSDVSFRPPPAPASP
jgi:hypothetical protein